MAARGSGGPSLRSVDAALSRLRAAPPSKVRTPASEILLKTHSGWQCGAQSLGWSPSCCFTGLVVPTQHIRIACRGVGCSALCRTPALVLFVCCVLLRSRRVRGPRCGLGRLPAAVPLAVLSGSCRLLRLLPRRVRFTGVFAISGHSALGLRRYVVPARCGGVPRFDACSAAVRRALRVFALSATLLPVALRSVQAPVPFWCSRRSFSLFGVGLGSSGFRRDCGSVVLFRSAPYSFSDSFLGRRAFRPGARRVRITPLVVGARLCARAASVFVCLGVPALVAACAGSCSLWRRVPA